MIGRIDLSRSARSSMWPPSMPDASLKKLNGYSGQRPQAERRDPEVGRAGPSSHRHPEAERRGGRSGAVRSRRIVDRAPGRSGARGH
jgi:hypothetical protein